MTGKIAVVTGANKGIGYGIVKELCRRGVGTVYLTSRDVSRCEKAVADLKKEGFTPIYFQLDVSERNSVKFFANHLRQANGGIDILINNAAIIPDNVKETTYEDSKKVIDTNYYSVLIIQELLFPLLNDKARVINISSDCGHISNLKNQYWIKRLTNEDIKVEDVNAFVDWFLDSVKNENLKRDDFAESVLLAYRVSKIAVCALTRVQQANIGRDISINSLHPGFVKTDMTKNSGVLTFEEASQAPVYLALDADQTIKGKFIWFDKSEKDWSDPQLDLLGKQEHLQDFLDNFR